MDKFLKNASKSVNSAAKASFKAAGQAAQTTVRV